MRTQEQKMEQIHMSLVNGQRQQMVEQIDEYILYDFWAEYAVYLESLYSDPDARWEYFTDATISYHRIKNR